MGHETSLTVSIFWSSKKDIIQLRLTIKNLRNAKTEILFCEVPVLIKHRDYKKIAKIWGPFDKNRLWIDPSIK